MASAIASAASTIASIPAAAAQAGEAALNSALKAANLEGGENKEKEGAEGETEKEEGEAASGEEVKEGEKEVKTVFDDPSGFNVKHPLFSRWTLYFHSPNTKNLPKTPSTTIQGAGAAGGWMDDIRKVVEFDCVEEFWGLYNNIIPPSQLPGKTDYYLFKDNIIPAWEDSANKNGGKWSVQLPRDKSRAQIDRMWLYTMLAAIGETFESDPQAKELSSPPNSGDDSDLITGVIVSTRPNFYRINIWTRLAPENINESSPLLDRILTIGKHFKTSVLGYDPEQRLAVGNGGFTTEVEFYSHKEGEKKGKKDKVVV